MTTLASSRIAYIEYKRDYLRQCETLIEGLKKAVRSVEEDKYHGNPLRSPSVAWISERYGSLSELHDIINTLTEEVKNGSR